MHKPHRAQLFADCFIGQENLQWLKYAINVGFHTQAVIPKSHW